MSEGQAMAVRAHLGTPEVDDERLNDVCLTIAETLVRMAGAVIAGAKAAAIFSVPMRAYSGGRWRLLVRQALDEALRAYAGALPAYGVRLSVLYRTERRVYLLVWRPALVEASLAARGAIALLRSQGYRGRSTDELMSELRRRLVAFYRAGKDGAVEFPHEIGLFLGYPVEDVLGFMSGAPATCSGPWHAYGDERTARRRFRTIEAKERRCRTRFAAGEPLGALFAPVRCAPAPTR